MEPLMDMRVSRVGPVVEGNLVQLVDLVKQMGRKGDLTESQNRRMVGYMGNLDEMRSQIVIMIQRYEDDSKVLKRLLDLVDRIDDVRMLAITAETSQGGEDKASLESDKEIAKQYDTPFNPLLVSTINILDVSGLFASNIREEDLVEEEEEEAGDEYWDHEDDPNELAADDEAPKEISSINLSVSNLYLPNLFDGEPYAKSNISLSTNSLHLSTLFDGMTHNAPKLSASASILPSSSSTSTTSHSTLSASTSKIPPSSYSSSSASSSSAPIDKKGKGKAKEVKSSRKTASKSKYPSGRAGMLAEIQARRANYSESESESSSSEEDSEINGAGSSRITIGAAKWTRTYPAGSSSASRPIQRSSSDSSSYSGSESETESEDESGPPPPPPMPSAKRNQSVSRRQKKGPCEPTLCKICYDEYTSWDKFYELRPCGHNYCRECWQDHLTTNINEGAVLDLACPFPGCECEVLPGDIKTLCTPETFAKFERFTVLAALRADPNARWCPNPYCNNGIKHNPATMPWVFCNSCKFEFCFHCMAERHDGAACGAEALAYLKKKRDSEQAAMDAFNEFTANMKSLVKPCPGCKNFIEKNDGCNHMTCGNPSCRTQFCWLCLNLYNGDHFSDEINFPDCYEKQYWTPPNEIHNVYVAPHTPGTRRFANIARKVGMYVGVGVAVVTLGVPAAVIGGPVYGCFQLHKRLKARRRAARQRNGTINYHGDGAYHPPSPARVAEAAREARRLYELEHS